MLLDVTTLLKNDGRYLDIIFNETIDGLISFSEEYELDKPVSFIGKLESNKGILILKGVIAVEYAAKCSRCLNRIDDILKIDIDEEIVAESDDSEEYTYKDNVVNLDKILTDNVILNLPNVKLCDENCKGLCITCGKNLNECKCDCSSTDTDPRFDVLKKFLK
jgi:uncharacterized protein